MKSVDGGGDLLRAQLGSVPLLHVHPLLQVASVADKVNDVYFWLHIWSLRPATGLMVLDKASAQT